MDTEPEGAELSDIGELESAVLSLVKALGSGSVSELLARAKSERRIAYTTLGTTLDRLYKKGLLRRKMMAGKGGHHYVYSYPESSTIQKEIVTKTIDRLVNAFGTAAVSNIYERLEQLSSEEVDELKNAIEKEKRRTRSD
jgi:predicted transcriptional regulator